MVMSVYTYNGMCAMERMCVCVCVCVCVGSVVG